MAVIFTYQCLTCNTNLGSDGGDISLHMSTYPTHTIREILYDDSNTLDTVEGTTRVYNNELYSYDESRGLWLSVTRSVLGYGIPSTNQVNVYLRLWGTMTPNNVNMGYYLTESSVITSIVATRTAGTGTGIFTLMSYGGSAITTYTLNAGVLSGYSMSVNVQTSGLVCCYLSGTTGSSYPQLVMEVATRI